MSNRFKMKKEHIQLLLNKKHTKKKMRPLASN